MCQKMPSTNLVTKFLALLYENSIHSGTNREEDYETHMHFNLKQLLSSAGMDPKRLL
jgi:hypothetical protein